MAPAPTTASTTSRWVNQKYYTEKKEFQWTDKLALEFASVCSGGAYGIYTGAHTRLAKLKIFKNTVEIKEAFVAHEIKKNRELLFPEQRPKQLKNRALILR